MQHLKPMSFKFQISKCPKSRSRSCKQTNIQIMSMTSFQTLIFQRQFQPKGSIIKTIHLSPISPKTNPEGPIKTNPRKTQEKPMSNNVKSVPDNQTFPLRRQREKLIPETHKTKQVPDNLNLVPENKNLPPTRQTKRKAPISQKHQNIRSEGPEISARKPKISPRKTKKNSFPENHKKIGPE